MRPNQPLAPMAARAVASATERCPAPRFCVTTTLTPMLIMRNKRKNEAWTWFDSVKAATAAADSCEAIDRPMSPTVIPSTRSANRGQVMASRLERCAGGVVAMLFTGKSVFQRGPSAPLLTALGLTFLDNAERDVAVKRQPTLHRRMCPTDKRWV